MRLRLQKIILIVASTVALLLVFCILVWQRRSSPERWNTFLVGDPRIGPQTFQQKGCSGCHSVLGVGIEVLRIFYDKAKIFVFPSLYEGFGLPPLETMAHGTPVVTSNTSSIPEVVCNAAVMVNPDNVFEIMKALHRVLLDQSVRAKLKARGLEQAGKFSWDASVRRMLEVYREVAQQN